MIVEIEITHMMINSGVSNPFTPKRDDSSQKDSSLSPILDWIVLEEEKQLTTNYQQHDNNQTSTSECIRIISPLLQDTILNHLTSLTRDYQTFPELAPLEPVIDVGFSPSKFLTNGRNNSLEDMRKCSPTTYLTNSTLNDKKSMAWKETSLHTPTVDNLYHSRYGRTYSKENAGNNQTQSTLSMPAFCYESSTPLTFECPTNTPPSSSSHGSSRLISLYLREHFHSMIETPSKSLMDDVSDFSNTLLLHSPTTILTEHLKCEDAYQKGSDMVAYSWTQQAKQHNAKPLRKPCPFDTSRDRWHMIICGKTAVQLEMTEKARIFMNGLNKRRAKRNEGKRNKNNTLKKIVNPSNNTKSLNRDKTNHEDKVKNTKIVHEESKRPTRISARLSKSSNHPNYKV